MKTPLLSQFLSSDQPRRSAAKALSREVTELEKRLGPEYFAPMNDLNNADLDSPDDREIDSILASLDDFCD